jgi:hypothetical protein
VLHAQAQMAEQPDDVVGRVDRHLLRADHAHIRVAEHAHHVLDGVFVRQRVAALQHADVTQCAALQEQVDGAGLALAPFLLDQLDARVLRHVFLDNLHRAVGAGAGDDDDLGDLDLVQC